MSIYVPRSLRGVRNISAQFIIPPEPLRFFILPRARLPALRSPRPSHPELLQCPPPQLLQPSANFAPPCPGRSLQPTAAASSPPTATASSTPGRLRPAQPRLALAGAALPVRLGPGPSRCCCARQPELRPVPPHPSSRAPISPTTVAPVRPGSDRFFFLLVCFFFFQALFFTLLCSRCWL
jgi:hypothetical protein